MKSILRLIALCGPALLAFPACSSGDFDAETPGEEVGSVTQELGEAACVTRAPLASFNGKIPEPGFITPASYSAPGCYKGYTVSFTNFHHEYGDIIVTYPDVDSVSWHPPAAPGNPTPPVTFPTYDPADDYVIGTPGPIPTSIPGITQPECENLWLNATLYDNGVKVRSVSSYGRWVKRGLSGYCVKPVISFGNFSTVNTGQIRDILWPSRTYTIAASARSSSASSAATKPIKFLTPPVRCGVLGQQCCGPQAESACEWNTACDAGTCNRCGNLGQAACPAPQRSCVSGAVPALTAVNGRCEACGEANQASCYDSGWSYACRDDSNFTCGSNGRCNAKPQPQPQPEPQPEPQPQPGVGGLGQACPCNGALECKPNFANEPRCFPPTANCGFVGQTCCTSPVIGSNDGCNPGSHCEIGSCKVNQ